MRENAQIIICQKYLRSSPSLEMEEIYQRIVRGKNRE